MSRRFLFKLWLAAFVVRLVGVAVGILFLRSFLVTIDTTATYFPIARSLASGQGFQIEGSYAAASGTAPLYPLWLSWLMRLAGPDLPLWLIGVFNAVWRALGCVVVYLLTRRYFGEKAALWSFALYVLDPWEMFWSGYVIKESLAVPLFLLAIWMLCGMADRPSAATATATGAIIGLAALARYASAALWIVGLYAVWRAVVAPGLPRPLIWRRSVFLAASLSLAMFFVLLPWIARRGRVGSGTTQAPLGYYLYRANGPGKVFMPSGYAEGTPADKRPLEQLKNQKTALGAERLLADLTFRHMLRHPDIVARNVAVKMISMWRPTWSAGSSKNWLLLGLPYCLLMGISIIGMVQAKRLRLPCLMLVMPLVVLIGLHLILWAEIRNRQYLTPLIYCFGGLAITSVIRRRESSPTNPPAVSSR